MKRGAAIRAATLAALVLPGTARADGYNIQVWQPVHDGSGAITTQGLVTLDDWTWRTGVSVDYARQPLALAFPGGSTELIGGATTGEMGVILGLPQKFLFEVDAPYANHHVLNPISADGNTGTTQVPSDGAGDLRFGLKRTLFEGGNHVPGFGAGGSLSLPTGDGESWFGASVVEGRVYGIAEDRFGPVLADVNVGATFRPRAAEVFKQEIGNSFSANGGISWESGYQQLQLVGDGYGTRLATGQAGFEAGAGVRREIIPGVSATLGANRGTGSVMGTPTWRVFGMINVDGSMFRHRTAPVVATRQPEPEPVREARPEPTPEPEPTLPLEPMPVLEEPAPKAEIVENALELNQSIRFELMRSEIKPESFPILNEVANQLRLHPEIKKVRIEGHTDSTGTEESNIAISQARANSVKSYLIGQGIEPSRIETSGYGPRRPIASNKTREGRIKNRRVEFNVLIEFNILKKGDPAPKPDQ